MSAQYQPPVPIVIPQGASWSQTYTYAQNADGTNPVDLSNYNAFGQIRKQKDRNTTLLATFGFDMTDAVNGNVTASLTPTITESISEDGFYDIELHHKTNTNDVIRLVQGPVYIDTEVTT